jgi:hypothetical protein
VKNGLNNAKHSEGRVFAWLMGGVVVLAFIAGPMVDVDHPLSQVLGIHHSRFLHPNFAIAGLGFVGIGIVLVIACICRYIQLRLLRK